MELCYSDHTDKKTNKKINLQLNIILFFIFYLLIEVFSYSTLKESILLIYLMFYLISNRLL